MLLSKSYTLELQKGWGKLFHPFICDQYGTAAGDQCRLYLDKLKDEWGPGLDHILPIHSHIHGTKG
jgi:hypothetical protein